MHIGLQMNYMNQYLIKDSVIYHINYVLSYYLLLIMYFIIKIKIIA
jgi:hypothetical protein